MPVYLCQSGNNTEEPWRHGIQVYSEPFNVDNAESQKQNPFSAQLFEGSNDFVVGVEADQYDLTTKALERANSIPLNHQVHESIDPTHANISMQRNDNAIRRIPLSPRQSRQTISSFRQSSQLGQPIRRVRHSEIVLIDDVCVAYDRYWLRLRWPGQKGGFAGYIAMGKCITTSSNNINNDGSEQQQIQISSDGQTEIQQGPATDVAIEKSDYLRCLRTGLAFQTSTLFKILSFYDDGIRPQCTFEPYPTEQIFCRICREGLHDDADAEQPTAEQDLVETPANNIKKKKRRDTSSDSIVDRGGDSSTLLDNDDENEEDLYEDDDDDTMTLPGTGPIQPTPSYHANADALQNPMLAPCDCAGSMAFVHYLCVEQWRCRSRHPDAANGLNCETCKKAYGLPPPSSRPDPQMEQEDWLEAMPPHVMHALRNPHIGWQIGAVIVNKRYIRLLVPAIISPIVALYCRSRRLLKKRGVARRRWACSLCRRRARWKCVRCLRSYYCSRQCQNVSWHIIHKHVCYKPVRFWSSVGAYTTLLLLFVPGILKDPIMYIIGNCLIVSSFFILAMLFGGIAAVIKEINNAVDIRGRFLELVVTILTIWMSLTSWGLVKGFFGHPEACYGNIGSHYVTKDEMMTANTISSMLKVFHMTLLKPCQYLFRTIDNIFGHSGYLIRRVVCSPKISIEDGCFAYLPKANADFFLHESDSAESSRQYPLGGVSQCASDLRLLIFLHGAAAFIHCVVLFRKFLADHRRRRLRNQQGGVGGRQARPGGRDVGLQHHLHQD